MEQHAVPQDITGFKFKLVGDMTLKQFGELAFGAIMAYLFFASPLHPVIKWPFVIFFIFLGIALAFLPIQERPLDIWIINFFKAIYKPTYFTWRKGAQNAVEKPPEVRSGFTQLTPHNSEVLPLMAAQNVQAFPKPVSVNPNDPTNSVPAPTNLTPVPVEPKVETPPAPPPVEETAPQAPLPPVENVPSSIDASANQASSASSATPPVAGVLSVDQLLSQRQQAPANNPPAPSMTIDDLMQQREHISTETAQKNEVELVNKEAKLSELSEKNLELLKKVDELRNQMYNISNSGGDASKLQPELDKIMAEKSEVLKNVGQAREDLWKQRVEPVSQPQYKEPTITHSPPKPKPAPLGPASFSLTNQPNVVNGLVLDTDGKPIEGVIITVKDAQGNSIRALRTSKVGQFIASTPLAAGEYYLELEKAGKVFDVWRVILNDTVITPIEIRSKEESGQQ